MNAIARPPMQQKLLNSQGKPFFSWQFDPENKWLYLNWTGYISSANGRAACLQFLQLMEENHYEFVLNDNRELLGPWGGGENATKWMKEYLFPKAIAAGLRYFAHVQSPGIASALLAQDLHQRLSPNLQMQIFGKLPKAMAWLKEKQEQENAQTRPGLD